MEPGAERHAITDALGALRTGDAGAMERLVPLVYGELSRIAHRQLGLEASGHTLSSAALVHEAYLRLVDQTRARWADRTQFFAVTAHAMRRVLVDHARRHRAARRGARARNPSPSRRSSWATPGISPSASAANFSLLWTRPWRDSLPWTRDRRASWSVGFSAV